MTRSPVDLRLASEDFVMPYIVQKFVPCKKGSGLYSIYSTKARGKKISVPEFQRAFPDTIFGNSDEIATKMWQQVTDKNTRKQYASDLDVWDIGDNTTMSLASLPGPLREGLGTINIPGVDLPFTYFGTQGSFFPLHAEDADLHSVSVLRSGHAKLWYIIPDNESDSFHEQLATDLPDEFGSCANYLRHKNLLAPPDYILRHNFHPTIIVQRQGELVFTFPKAVHQGMNLGFNKSEAVNFGTRGWLRHGVESVNCNCSNKNSLKLEMTPFLLSYSEHRHKEIDELKEDLKKAVTDVGVQQEANKRLEDELVRKNSKVIEQELEIKKLKDALQKSEAMTASHDDVSEGTSRSLSEGEARMEWSSTDDDVELPLTEDIEAEGEMEGEEARDDVNVVTGSELSNAQDDSENTRLMRQLVTEWFESNFPSRSVPTIAHVKDDKYRLTCAVGDCKFTRSGFLRTRHQKTDAIILNMQNHYKLKHRELKKVRRLKEE